MSKDEPSALKAGLAPEVVWLISAARELAADCSADCAICESEPHRPGCSLANFELRLAAYDASPPAGPSSGPDNSLCVDCGAPARWLNPSHCDSHRAAEASLEYQRGYMAGYAHGARAVIETPGMKAAREIAEGTAARHVAAPGSGNAGGGT